MRRYDFTASRLYVETDLAPGKLVTCRPDQVNYLRHVLRLNAGDRILVFNGRDGEWQASIGEARKGAMTLHAESQVRPQQGAPDIDYLFAPLKRARLDYMVQKATEMGVARLRPVFTRRTTPERINGARMRANAIEAAEQCGILRVPEVLEPETLGAALAHWQVERHLVFCDEDSEAADPLAALRSLARGPIALLIGPEGGFDAGERELITSQPFALSISLGPRILRADTAAVAALALVNATLGDWR
jgi:16S rRNA (uracil1498-N3)-methyltransferase